MSNMSQAPKSLLEFEKFTTTPPSVQNALNLFKDKWASDISEVLPGTSSGPHKIFVQDRRPSFALQYLTNNSSSFSGMKILELGPLEGAHSYQLEKLGADEIVAVEANAEAYLKCLIVKELLGLSRCRFLYGDFVQYLRSIKPHAYDLIFCSGVLYHMPDPIDLIQLICSKADKVFLWSHYWIPGQAGRDPQVVSRSGSQYTYYQRTYPNRERGTFWGGNSETASWLSRDDIMQAFSGHGLINREIHVDNPRHGNGPAICASFWR